MEHLHTDTGKIHKNQLLMKRPSFMKL